MKKVYGDDFYEDQMKASYESAKIYAGLLFGMISPESVVDVGCGRGTWLKAFREAGAKRLVGLDGNWNSQDNIVDDAVSFTAVDLNRPLPAPAGGRFDLAMSLEVAEHLEPGNAAGFVESLTGLSDTVMFGAAFPGQGGTNHINERVPSYWAGLFLARGYVPFDAFRPLVWGDPRVCFWYRQNTFLYVREGSEAIGAVRAGGLSPMPDVSFMDCPHPELYFRHARQSFGRGFKMIRSSIARGIRSRLAGQEKAR